jgi:DEAD/DEAH box helicase domain-containing protein
MLQARDLARPFAHQAHAIDAVMHGRDVVIATGTASGKSLCFQLPILDATLRDRDAKALLLFPTKALARDQCASMRALVGTLPAAVRVGVAPYDGDTPPDERRAARSRASVVATNPDMLHRGVLPMHEGWGRFLAGLRYIVLDELHT